MTPVTSVPNYFELPTSIFNRFYNKIVYLRSETHTAYKFYTLYTQTTAFLEGNFCLRVENVMRVCDPLFSHQIMV